MRRAPWVKTERVVRGQRGELVGRGHERQARDVGDLARHPVAELGVRVEPGADGRPPGGQLVEPGERQLNPLDVRRQLGHVPGELLPEGQRHGVHEMGAPDFGDVLELHGPGLQRVAEGGHRAEQPEHDLLGHRDVHGGREGVVRRLRHVDVVVGMDGLLGAHDPAAELDGPVGDDLVGVHVGLRAAARLPDAQRELVVEVALGHLARRLLDEAGQGLVQLAEVAVDRGRRALEDPEGPDQRLGHRLDADVEVVQGALGLGAPVAVGGDLDLPHAVAFDTGVRHGRQLRTGAAGPPLAGLAPRGRTHRSGAASPSSSRMAASRVGTPSLRRMDETWLRTVVGETNRRSRDLGGAGPLAHELEHVPLAAGEPGRLAVGHGDPAVLAVTELVDQPGHEGPGQRGLPGQDALERVADGGLVQALEQIARTRRPAARRRGPRPGARRSA